MGDGVRNKDSRLSIVIWTSCGDDPHDDRESDLPTLDQVYFDSTSTALKL